MYEAVDIRVRGRTVCSEGADQRLDPAMTSLLWAPVRGDKRAIHGRPARPPARERRRCAYWRCAARRLRQPPSCRSQPPSTGTQCVDDSADCIGKRQAESQDDDGRQEPKLGQAAGRRRGLRLRRPPVRLSRQAQGARPATSSASASARPTARMASLRGPGGAGLTPAQVSRGSMLAGGSVARARRRDDQALPQGVRRLSAGYHPAFLSAGPLIRDQTGR